VHDLQYQKNILEAEKQQLQNDVNILTKRVQDSNLMITEVQKTNQNLRNKVQELENKIKSYDQYMEDYFLIIGRRIGEKLRNEVQIVMSYQF
jgi:peptidoglycan hydrolase CwlO-like protein